MSLFDFFKLFQGSVFAFFISVLGNDSEPFVYRPYILCKILFPFSKRNGVRVSSLILRVYAILSAAFCAVSILGQPPKWFYVPSLATFVAAVAIALSVEVCFWIKYNWNTASIWKKIGAFILLMVMVCFAGFAILLDVMY